MKAEAAIRDALTAGKALCKVISRNNVGVTGSHECGFYLPKSVWQMFATQPPTKGVNHKHTVQILWPEKLTTESVVTWYGTGTRSEYRLTRFGKDFPWLDEKCVGSLLVLVPFSLDVFHAHVLQTEDDIELLEASLGIDVIGGWAAYESGKTPLIETEDECLNRKFSEAARTLDDFPNGEAMANIARRAVAECIRHSASSSADTRLLNWMSAEFQLFRSVERKLCLPHVTKPFNDLDEFIAVASSIMQRRKSRAGHSLEHHVEYLLETEGIPFEPQPQIDGKVKPDILIPGKSAYENPNYPTSKLMVVGLKRTCKDRWRQVLNEGRRVSAKHILTIQEAISVDQLKEMREANVTLIVPKKYHANYDTASQIRLLSVEEFVATAKQMTLAA